MEEKKISYIKPSLWTLLLTVIFAAVTVLGFVDNFTFLGIESAYQISTDQIANVVGWVEAIPDSLDYVIWGVILLTVILFILVVGQIILSFRKKRKSVYFAGFVNIVSSVVIYWVIALLALIHVQSLFTLVDYVTDVFADFTNNVIAGIYLIFEALLLVCAVLANIVTYIILFTAKSSITPEQRKALKEEKRAKKEAKKLEKEGKNEETKEEEKPVEEVEVKTTEEKPLDSDEEFKRKVILAINRNSMFSAPYGREETRTTTQSNQSNVTLDDIRKVIHEELGGRNQTTVHTITTPAAAPAQAPVEDEDNLSKDDVRSIVKDELKDMISLLKLKQKETVIIKEEAPKPVVQEKGPTTIEVRVPRAQEQHEAPTVELQATDDADALKVERIPFSRRMMDASDEVKERYNNLKSLLKSYGLNNRVSNSGDTFRLHRVTYCKMTIAGKALKLYLALNPKDYANTTIPIKDASAKAAYKDIPLTFKVKSELSYRRAEQLIRDCMEKNNIEQIDQVASTDWVSKLEEEEKN